jgi:hypothetical protein
VTVVEATTLYSNNLVIPDYRKRVVTKEKALLLQSENFNSLSNLLKNFDVDIPLSEGEGLRFYNKLKYNLEKKVRQMRNPLYIFEDEKIIYNVINRDKYVTERLQTIIEEVRSESQESPPPQTTTQSLSKKQRQKRNKAIKEISMLGSIDEIDSYVESLPDYMKTDQTLENKVQEQKTTINEGFTVVGRRGGKTRKRKNKNHRSRKKSNKRK